MFEPDIVFFDMDHTLLDIDCDVSWKYFLADEGLAPEIDRAKADHYLEVYLQGETPIDEFLGFQLCEFIGRTPEEMRSLAERHFSERVEKRIYPKARREIAKFSAEGVPTALLTGTNEIIAEPVARHLGISDLLATELEIIDGRFTGFITGSFLSKEGKLKRALEYCRAKNCSLERTAFYADSVNDLQMLERVGEPIVVNPRQKLLAIAQARNWRIEQWSP
ncbi:MAG: HAD family phosphatase [bacterium]